MMERLGALREILTELRMLAQEAERAGEARAAGPPKEIERKYLLTGLPPRARRGRRKELWQGYLPGEQLQERVRRVKSAEGERFVRTVKLGRGVSRVEVEEACSRALFSKLWPLTRGKRVHKRRWVVKDRTSGLTWELDEFLDRELFLAEVELPSEDVVPEVPAWLAPYVVREVTEEGAYVNVNLAR